MIGHSSNTSEEDTMSKSEEGHDSGDTCGDTATMMQHNTNA